ncbi:hypothetical protein [Lutibacter sp. Hel_I_33_5]|uniref:hypothetical protein n=1 Tax=Lutibacter sp. Hel_I_33_5 TaxID=1566289 RepID=UPI0011A30C9D|nr:hypothetical protein [Lutibacter sp. Hel_I_33_5]
MVKINSNTAWTWFKKAMLLVLFSLIVNHIVASDNFLESSTYRFPLVGFLFTIGLLTIVGFIAHFNFKFHKKKKVEVTSIVRFMASTLGYITLVYVPINIVLELLIGGFFPSLLVL